MANPILGYIDRRSPIHRLTGTSKLILSVGLIVAAAITFDARVLLGLAVLNIALWVAARLRFRDMKVVLTLILVFMVLNNLFIFLFAPAYGTDLFGTTHVLINGPGRWDLSQEQLFYQGLVTLKYFAVLPAVLVFVGTTPPSEFAASLNSVGVPYKAAYAVALALRFIPDVQRDFHTVSLAQQARGIDISRRVGLWTRVKNATSMLMPLLLGTLDRIETIAAAMELRGFGRGRKRTWFSARRIRPADVAVVLLMVGAVVVAIVMLRVNGGRFWNPFA
ncbi:energy-coupling factor transporter transmembrane component T family protein [Neoactinobaculum massilliense]|uniref:energy-coupling factor transporter transmembrane component T family protein n=1 Tax=Neoactinobaculum massilliense TaxID=2364794 RepID=UPI000F545707|nr:energy-coupling factor transporter transmembrane component T [Neoactinobaculum massilliense]